MTNFFSRLTQQILQPVLNIRPERPHGFADSELNAYSAKSTEPQAAKPLFALQSANLIQAENVAAMQPPLATASQLTVLAEQAKTSQLSSNSSLTSSGLHTAPVEKQAPSITTHTVPKRTEPREQATAIKSVAKSAGKQTSMALKKQQITAGTNHSSVEISQQPKPEKSLVQLNEKSTPAVVTQPHPPVTTTHTALIKADKEKLPAAVVPTSVASKKQQTTATVQVQEPKPSSVLTPPAEPQTALAEQAKVKASRQLKPSALNHGLQAVKQEERAQQPLKPWVRPLSPPDLQPFSQRSAARETKQFIKNKPVKVTIHKLQVNTKPLKPVKTQRLVQANSRLSLRSYLQQGD